jgi:hypothetical protein
MGSSFDDLVETSPSVKTDFQSDKRFELQNILNIQILHIMLGLEIKLETRELNEFSKTWFNLARTRTLMSQAKLVFFAVKKTSLISRVTSTR